jgi:alanine racemase
MLFKNNPNFDVEISSSAFNHNVAEYKKIIAERKLGIVIKGNAYGHGFDLILELSRNNPAIEWYFTATLSEALYIRSLGIEKPILVMSIIDRDPLLAFKQNIRLLFHQREQFADLERAYMHGLQPIIHLKVDTGLSRFGFLPAECFDIVERIRSMPHVTLEGIFTHFAQAELVDQTYTNRQTEEFNALHKDLAHLVHIPLVHSHATSATLMRGPENTNLFRVGAGIYGLWPSRELQAHAQQAGISLKQILTWKTRVMHIRTVAAGTPIGYGCSYIAARPMQLAFLPVGYADGYHRNLSNTGTVMINNQRAPVVGKVGMNCITVDISHVKDARIGSEVMLTGPFEGITALDLAYAAKSFNPREITTSLRGENHSLIYDFADNPQRNCGLSEVNTPLFLG